jgi:hypothetical protein
MGVIGSRFPHRQRIPSSEADHIAALATTHSLNQIAAIYKCSQKAVSNFISRHGLPKTCGARPLLVDGTPSTKTSGYYSWRHMIRRCEERASRDFPAYGGRGIRVCERWRESFVAFIEDMGPRPAGHSIERRDNDRDYCPGNCYWLPSSQQHLNKRSQKKFTQVTLGGTTKSLDEWCADLGFSRSMVLIRVTRRGMTVEQALTTPRGKHKKFLAGQ